METKSAVIKATYSNVQFEFLVALADGRSVSLASLIQVARNEHAFIMPLGAATVQLAGVYMGDVVSVYLEYMESDKSQLAALLRKPVSVEQPVPMAPAEPKEKAPKRKRKV